MRRFRWISFVAVFSLLACAPTAHAQKRVALVIGQNAYTGGAPATAGLPALENPARDARRMAELLGKYGFEVVACDGTTPGCFDLDRTRFLEALGRFERRSVGADLALVFFAGHGTATPEGNILTPTDAKIDCTTGVMTNGVPVERIMAATQAARHKLVILDACRDNPLDDVCPSLRGKKLTFTRIEPGAMHGLLLVTSTQFGQQALDGPPGYHSPFATALFAALENNPSVYFDQVLNEVARATYEAAQKQQGLIQIPGRVVGGEAPADCLAGKGCVGDARMAALAVENERLAVDASGVRTILAVEEQARGKAYTAEERLKRVAELQETLARMGASTDPLRREARRLIGAGNVAGGRAKLDEALDADEKGIAEAERVAAEKRKVAAQSARDLAVLARGTDIVRAVAYFQRATRLDPSDPAIWDAYARAARDAGRTGDAKAAFEQAAAKATEANDMRWRYWATLGLGDIAMTQGSLQDALRHYQAAVAILEPTANRNPGNAGLQRDLSLSQGRIGDVLRAQGNLSAALESYRAAYQTFERLAKANPRNTDFQRDLSVLSERIGDVLRSQGNLAQALERHLASHDIVQRLAKANPGDPALQRDIAMSHGRIGGVLRTQGNLAAALDSYRAAFAITERLAKADPGNAVWQRNLSVSHISIGDVLHAQGNLVQALESYRAAFVVRERLVKADPSNAGWQRDLASSHGQIGDVLRSQGNLSQALESYGAALAIFERLAKADPGNTSWARDLALSYGRVGEVLRVQGNFAQALESQRASQAVFQRLANTDPGNSGWQQDLSASHGRIGDVLRDQGALAQALESYRAAVAIFERLANADPGNSGWQRDLAVGYGRVATVLARQGSRGEAVLAFEQQRSIIARLLRMSPDNATLRRDLTWVDEQLAALRN